MPLFCEICFRGPIVGYLFAIARDSPARRARVWPIGAPPINANAGLCMKFVYGVQEIRLISPDNFADSCWESNFPHRPSRTSAIVLQRATGSVQADK